MTPLGRRTFTEALTVRQQEVAGARATCAARALEDTAPFMGGEVSLRWISTGGEPALDLPPHDR